MRQPHKGHGMMVATTPSMPDTTLETRTRLVEYTARVACRCFSREKLVLSVFDSKKWVGLVHDAFFDGLTVEQAASAIKRALTVAWIEKHGAPVHGMLEAIDVVLDLARQKVSDDPEAAREQQRQLSAIQALKDFAEAYPKE